MISAWTTEWRFRVSGRWQGFFLDGPYRTKMASGLCRNVCFVCLVVLKLRIPLLECYSGLLSFPSKLPVWNPSGMPPYEKRKLGVYFTKPDTSAAGTSVEVSTCSVPFCQGFWRSCYTLLQTSAETQMSYLIGYEHQHCFCNLMFPSYISSL